MKGGGQDSAERAGSEGKKGGQDSAERAGSEGMKGGGRIVLRGRGVRA